MATPRLDRLEKNYLINGGMDFAQRIGSSTVNLTTSVAYYLDRWLCRFNGTYTGTPTTRQESTGPDGRAQYCTRVDGNASNAAANYEFRQRIEAIHSLEMTMDGKASFSAWIYSESATIADLRLFTPDVFENFGAVTAFPAFSGSRTLTLGQWNYVKWENITVPASASRGIDFRIELNNMSVTGLSKIHRLTQVQGNAGRKVGVFTRSGRTIADELVACQRYYEKSWPLGDSLAAASLSHVWYVAYNSSGNPDNRASSVGYKVTKRVNASVTTYGQGKVSGQVEIIPAASGGSDVSVSVFANTTAGFTLFRGSASGAGTMNLFWTADAEI